MYLLYLVRFELVGLYTACTSHIPLSLRAILHYCAFVPWCCDSIANAVACTTDTECQACPSTRPRQCEPGWCNTSTNTCHAAVCVARNQQCPVRSALFVDRSYIAHFRPLTHCAVTELNSGRWQRFNLQTQWQPRSSCEALYIR